MKAFVKISFLVISIVLFLLQSCKSPTGPVSLQPGRRDYVWTTDTLDMEMNFIHTIWGSSPNDVWAMGAGGTAYDRLWHYDGSSWKPYNKEPIYCNGFSLFGYGPDNVWMGGGGSVQTNGASIWHFDGKNWTPNFIYNVSGSYLVTILNINGSQPNDVYACGDIGYYDGKTSSNVGFVLHYDGKQWKEIVKGTLNHEFSKIGEENGKAYIYSAIESPLSSNDDSLLFYELNDGILSDIYSNSEGIIHWINFFHIYDQMYFLLDRNVCFFKEGRFITRFSINEPEFQYYLFGRNEKDIFLNMKDGLAHYNGEDVQYLLNYPKYSRSFGEAAVFEKDVFQVYVDQISGKNMVLHGKLKN